ncbi:nuclear transport factor 2 family protein [Chloroflexota bacterium]
MMHNSKNPGIDGLLQRLEALEDERAIMNTMYRYGHCIDYGLEQEWVELFAEDGIYEVRVRTTNDVLRKEGSQALSRFIAKHTRAPSKYHKHLLMEPLIAIKDGNTATAESFFVRVDDYDGKPYILAFGRYRDRFVRDNNRWLFKERVCEVEALRQELVGT